MSVVLLTGASRGLGRAIAEEALARGHRLVATARRSSEVADLVADAAGRAIAVDLDITDDDAIDEAVRTTLETFGRIDTLIDNAGYADLGSVEEMPMAAIRRQIDTNLVGKIALARAVLPSMRAAGSGSIIEISSVGARAATAGLGAYQAAKWGISGFVGVLAAEVAPLGIRVTAIEPGGIRTDWAGSSMTAHPFDAAYEPTVGRMARMHDSGFAAGDPTRLAAVVLDVAELPDPPVRLLTGSDAIVVAKAFEDRQAASDARWAEFGRRSDAADATPEQLDPLGQSAN